MANYETVEPANPSSEDASSVERLAEHEQKLAKDFELILQAGRLAEVLKTHLAPDGYELAIKTDNPDTLGSLSLPFELGRLAGREPVSVSLEFSQSTFASITETTSPTLVIDYATEQCRVPITNEPVMSYEFNTNTKLPSAAIVEDRNFNQEDMQATIAAIINPGTNPLLTRVDDVKSQQFQEHAANSGESNPRTDIKTRAVYKFSGYLITATHDNGALKDFTIELPGMDGESHTLSTTVDTGYHSHELYLSQEGGRQTQIPITERDIEDYTELIKSIAEDLSSVDQKTDEAFFEIIKEEAESSSPADNETTE